jgi:molybdopterin converting factor subunit 1
MRILYFAWVRETVGRAEETVAPPADVATVEALIAWLARLSANHARAFADRARIRAAVNHEHAPFARAIGPADEIAFFPPVTGGGAGAP